MLVTTFDLIQEIAQQRRRRRRQKQHKRSYKTIDTIIQAIHLVPNKNVDDGIAVAMCARARRGAAADVAVQLHAMKGERERFPEARARAA